MSLPRGALRHLTPPLPAIKGPAPHPILHSDNSHAQGNTRFNSFCSVVLLMIRRVLKNTRSKFLRNLPDKKNLTYICHLSSSSYWLRESLAPPNNNGPNNKRRGREPTALRGLLPAMRRCLSTGRRWPRTIPGKRSLSTGKSKRSPLRKDKLLMVQQSLPWRSYHPNPSNTSTV